MASRGNASVRVNIKYNKLGKIAKQLPLETSKSMRKAALLIQRTAIKTAPKKTGTLKNSISTEGVTPGSLSMTIFTDCNYGAYVNFGTRYMAARPFMTNAAQVGADAFMADLARLESRLG